MKNQKKQTVKHTPGPWKYEEATKTIRAVPSNYWLASMDSWDGAVDHGANARLITAAPELLEALKLAEIALVDLGACDSEVCECPQVLVKVRAALAKAEAGQ